MKVFKPICFLVIASARILSAAEDGGIAERAKVDKVLLLIPGNKGIVEITVFRDGAVAAGRSGETEAARLTAEETKSLWGIVDKVSENVSGGHYQQTFHHECIIRIIKITRGFPT